MNIIKTLKTSLAFGGNVKYSKDRNLQFINSRIL